MFRRLASWTSLPLRNLVLGGVAVLACVGMHWAVTSGKVPRIYFEAQAVACLPWDFYLPNAPKHGAVHRGDVVRFRARGITPMFRDGTPMAKIAAGLPGDRIAIRRDRLYINGLYWGSVSRGLFYYKKPSGYFDREFTILPGQIFVLGTEPRSFDSRYWGPIKDDQVDGTLSVLF
ncbi:MULTISPECIES: signal peptidase I [Burkholderia]|uniref:signal peptidase I n=1 Tax=Burkholderia TaxID=32008 RepID=UPI001FC7F6FE|nr:MULTISPECIES: signal peptidase I [Burkholderia]